MLGSSCHVKQFEFSPALLAFRISSWSSYRGKKFIAPPRPKPTTVWKIKSKSETAAPQPISEKPKNDPHIEVPNKLKATVIVKEQPASYDPLILEFISSKLAHDGGSDKEITKIIYTSTLKQFLGDGDERYVCELDLPDGFGEVDAVKVLHYGKAEIFLKEIVVTSFLGSANSTTISFACNSWVQPSNNRVFFPNKSYLPKDTPSGIMELRKQELKNLRGEGPNQDEQGQRKYSDRIYAYDKYNDLGNPAEEKMVRPVLGGRPDHPYPRRCRTGRECLIIGTGKEDREKNTKEDYYVPRDEVFSTVKGADYMVKQSQILAIIEKNMAEQEISFPDFATIDKLFKFSDQSPDENSFQFPEPILRDRSAWTRDEEFARQTLAGLNPLSIELVKEWPIKSKLDPIIYGVAESAITNDIVKEQIHGIMTVEEAVNNKKLFMIDYHDLLLPYVEKVRKLEGTTLYGSRTLFFLKENNTLMPVAIELTRPIIDDEPQWRHVFTPSSDATKSWLWRFAKAHVLAHDSGYHQLVSHWLRTHCCTEPYIIAANRQLSVMHPIYKLLHPHFRYTMAINANARKSLINADGTIEKCFSPKKHSMELSSAAYKLWRFDMEALPKDLIRRGMAVKNSEAKHGGVKLIIEDYPYAKDGLELWDAIETWVTDYVGIYYLNKNAIANDTELQAWWTEVRTKGHEDKKDEPWWPVLNTTESLIQTLTTIIWVASGHHAAVNFGQYDYAGYFPNRPTIARTNVPNEALEFKNFIAEPEAELLKCFPSQIQAITVIGTLNVLSNHSPDEEYIGDKLQPFWTEDKEVEQIFKKFQGELENMNKSIQDRNNDNNLRNRTGPCVTPYTLLKQVSLEPGVTGKGVPNSISI